MLQSIDTLLFDLDGTLVDSWPAIHAGILHTLDQLGLPEKSFNEVLAFGPKGMIDLWQWLLGTMDETRIDRAVGIYRRAFSQRLYKEIVVFPGVVEMFEHFKGKTNIVVTNGLADLSWQILAHVGLKGHIDDLVGGDDIGCIKPMACPLEKGLDRIEQGRQGALMVGDMVVDVNAGKAAGVATCAVTYGVGRAADLRAAGPDYMIAHMSELKTIVAV